MDVCSIAKWQLPERSRFARTNAVYWPTFQDEYERLVSGLPVQQSMKALALKALEMPGINGSI